ncbi:MAG TPA: hypothetical protein VNN10_01860 [Dehalococcoidia bacterium]|nr:hypothetical protein [Dehalococcoidia bacterium]
MVAVRWFDLVCALIWLTCGSLLVLVWSRGGPHVAFYAGAALVLVASASGLVTRGWRDYRAAARGWRKAFVSLPRWSMLMVLVIVTSVTTCSLPS